MVKTDPKINQIHYWDKDSSIWSKPACQKKKDLFDEHCVKNLSLRWIMNYWTKIHLYEESSSLWWNLIDVVNVYQCDENLITAVFDENSLLRVKLTKFINAMKI